MALHYRIGFAGSPAPSSSNINLYNIPEHMGRFFANVNSAGIRVQVDWDAAEPTEITADPVPASSFPNVRSKVEDLTRSRSGSPVGAGVPGDGIMFQIMATPAWARFGSGTNIRYRHPTDPKKYGAFIRKLASVFWDDGVRNFECWNEPNIFMFGNDLQKSNAHLHIRSMARMTISAYNEVKTWVDANDPGEPFNIISGGLANSPREWKDFYLYARGMLEENWTDSGYETTKFIDCITGLGYHPYSIGRREGDDGDVGVFKALKPIDEDSADNRFRHGAPALHNLIYDLDITPTKARAGAIRIWNTETGFDHHPNSQTGYGLPMTIEGSDYGIPVIPWSPPSAVPAGHTYFRDSKSESEAYTMGRQSMRYWNGQDLSTGAYVQPDPVTHYYTTHPWPKGTQVTTGLYVGEISRDPKSEVQVVKATGATGGTFQLKLTRKRVSTDPAPDFSATIDYNDTAAQVKTHLESANNINPGDITCSGGAINTTGVTITFASGSGFTAGIHRDVNLDPLIINIITPIVGGTLSVTTTRNGGNASNFDRPASYYGVGAGKPSPGWKYRQSDPSEDDGEGSQDGQIMTGPWHWYRWTDYDTSGTDPVNGAMNRYKGSYLQEQSTPAGSCVIGNTVDSNPRQKVMPLGSNDLYDAMLTWSAPTDPPSIGSAGAANINTVSDNFNDDSVNTTLWDISPTSGPDMPTEVGKRAKTPCSGDGFGGSFFQTDAVYTFDVNDNDTWIEVPTIPHKTAGGLLSVHFGLLSADGTDAWKFHLKNNIDEIATPTGTQTLHFVERLNGVDTSVTSTTYSPTLHRWWRLSFGFGVVIWWTSPDGLTWVQRTNKSPVAGFPITTDLKVMFGSYFSGTAPTFVSGKTFALFDNFRITPNAAANTLVDNFTDNSINTTLWTTAGTVTETGNRLRVSTLATESSLSSAIKYNLENSAVFVETTKMPTDTNGTTIASLRLSFNSSNRLLIRKEGANLIFRHTVAGVQFDGSPITYNATDHRWWRIRESDGTIYWDTSPTGAVWTNRKSVAVSTLSPLDVTSLNIQLTSQFTGTEPAADYAEFDNVNLLVGSSDEFITLPTNTGGIKSEEAVGIPAVTFGSIVISPTGIASEEAVGSAIAVVASAPPYIGLPTFVKKTGTMTQVHTVVKVGGNWTRVTPRVRVNGAWVPVP